MPATNPLLICTMPSSRMISSRGANNVTGQRDAYECPLWVISGHKSADQRMSAFPLKADILSAALHVRYVPLADIVQRSAYVRFTPESRHSSARLHVRYVPIADMLGDK